MSVPLTQALGASSAVAVVPTYRRIAFRNRTHTRRVQLSPGHAASLGEKSSRSYSRCLRPVCASRPRIIPFTLPCFAASAGTTTGLRISIGKEHLLRFA